MANTAKGNTDKAPNYSVEQEQTLIQSAPISYDDAVAFATEWGKTSRSVIAKVNQLGLEYIPKAKPSKKVSKGDTKAELVAKIEAALDAADMLAGLEKANAQSLVNLLGCARVAMREARES